MTEAEWLASTDPQPMLEYLRGKGSDRNRRRGFHNLGVFHDLFSRILNGEDVGIPSVDAEPCAAGSVQGMLFEG